MFKYMAGDFPEGTLASDKRGALSLIIPTGNFWKPEPLQLKDNVKNVEVVTEENKAKILGKVGWGIAGSLLGPVGTVAGLVLGGRKKEIVFVCELKDGKRFIGKADPKTHQKLLVLCFRRSSS